MTDDFLEPTPIDWLLLGGPLHGQLIQCIERFDVFKHIEFVRGEPHGRLWRYIPKTVVQGWLCFYVAVPAHLPQADEDALLAEAPALLRATRAQPFGSMALPPEGLFRADAERR